jgi:uncharacterized FAD-dependent dehydrogenase
MSKNIPHALSLRLSPAEANEQSALIRSAAELMGVPEDALERVVVRRRSIDARGRRPMVEMSVEVYRRGEEPAPEPALLEGYRSVADGRPVVVVGAGPAGYFAALELIERGLRPIVLDRGKDVRARRRDLRAIQVFGEVNPHSNYCFGEGGAGTYSDGKLYTRSTKRGDIEKVLRLLVEHGANADILVDAHPHIGSNKLPNVVANLRETILHYGGEVHFGAWVTDLVVRDGQLLGVVVNQGERVFLGDATILATGHSARDIFYLLHQKGVRLEAKPFALGVRIEHPQALIDELQYKQRPRDPLLPASSYRLACQVDGRGVFSFCMCPGGLIVPAATAPGELVVNGMSMSRRDSPYANSGLVVAVDEEDLSPYRAEGPFAALAFQREVEQRLFEAGDGSQKAPAQTVPDFVAGKPSISVLSSSYIPGLYAAPLHELLPAGISGRLRKGLQQFGRSMRGYFTGEAQVVGTESRTSSPVRIPRDPATLESPDLGGLFPCGEGPGYAGGIVSAAMDGQRVATAIAQKLVGH